MVYSTSKFVVLNCKGNEVHRSSWRFLEETLAGRYDKDAYMRAWAPYTVMSIAGDAPRVVSNGRAVETGQS